jgi:hypothetical protein
MQIAFAFACITCGLMVLSGPAQGEGSKPTKKVNPATVPAVEIQRFLDATQAASEARREADKALLSWVAARAAEQGAAATKNRLFFDTTEEEKAASLEIENVATRQATTAREMIVAQERYDEARKAAPLRRLDYYLASGDRADQAEKARSGPNTDDLHAAERAGFEAWKQAQSEADRLDAISDKAGTAYRGEGKDNKRPRTEADHEPALSPPLAPSTRPVIGSSWWCGIPHIPTDAHPCKPTRESCEHMIRVLLSRPYATCVERPEVSIIESRMANVGMVYSAYQYLSECENDRKQRLKNKVDYRWVGKCQSSRGFSP